ncbi:acyl-CoA carboxylase epsilon subunit [Streptomyces sp. NPDC058274]|uniref:acyl-CoA carboxylase epsilon subunit n=1 Tax=Streptomyces sp. NPDC058274 TaxID=3346416 RepID=UPI0036E84E54
MTTAAEELPVVRVVRGGELPEEGLAALTAVLLARAAAVAAEAESVDVVPLWERPTPVVPYRSPHSWRN